MHEILTSFIKVCHMVGFISLPAGLQFPVKWRLCLCEAYFVKQIFVKTFSAFINRKCKKFKHTLCPVLHSIGIHFVPIRHRLPLK